MLRFLKRLVLTVLFLIAIVIITPIAGLAYGFLTSPAPKQLIVAAEIDPPPAALKQKVLAEIPGYARPESATYLTYPEWSIVYAAQDYATHVARSRESGFAYWTTIGRYWQDYAQMVRATRAYPFNFDNHLMLVVIGTSHTIEHAVQWAYENTIGRATELAAPVPVGEDVFQAKTATAYALFLNQTPWYRFDYAGSRTKLWAIEPARGWAAVRSWERKLAFALSYTIKQAYADLIASGLEATSDPAALKIHIWAKGPVARAIEEEPDTSLELDFEEAGAVFVTRRYQAFTDMVPRLINRGIRFVEIGGNDLIFITVLSIGPLPEIKGASVTMSHLRPARDNVWRTGLTVPVALLHSALPALDEAGARLEHIYDY